jgi:hypothetical protein
VRVVAAAGAGAPVNPDALIQAVCPDQGPAMGPGFWDALLAGRCARCTHSLHWALTARAQLKYKRDKQISRLWMMDTD